MTKSLLCLKRLMSHTYFNKSIENIYLFRTLSSNINVKPNFVERRPNCVGIAPYSYWAESLDVGSQLKKTNLYNVHYIDIRYYATSSGKPTTEQNADESNIPQQKLSLVQKFKSMMKSYWYVLIPVHIVTSIGWFAGFYYLLKSGVDVVSYLESWNVSEAVIKPLRDSSAGYIAIAYAMYKIATPVRYTVTLGGTTVSINYLKKWGLIKPIPPKEKLKEIYKEKKENLKEKRDMFTEEIKIKKEQFKEKRANLMQRYRDGDQKS